MYPSALLPFITTLSGLLNLVNGVPQAMLAATTRERYILGWACGNTTCPISIETAGGEIARVFAPAETSMVLFSRRLSAPNTAVTVTAQGVNSPAVSFTFVFADCPHNVLSPIVIGPG